MTFKLHLLLAAAGLVACGGTMAADQAIDIKRDTGGKHYVVEKQGAAERPVLITKRLASDQSTHFMKRAFDCKNWTVRNLGEGPTLDAMNKGTADPEATPIGAGSIPDHFARHACPTPHPAPRP